MYKDNVEKMNNGTPSFLQFLSLCVSCSSWNKFQKKSNVSCFGIQLTCHKSLSARSKKMLFCTKRMFKQTRNLIFFTTAMVRIQLIKRFPHFLAFPGKNWAEVEKGAHMFSHFLLSHFVEINFPQTEKRQDRKLENFLETGVKRQRKLKDV